MRRRHDLQLTAPHQRRAIFFNSKYPTESGGRLQLKPASAITDNRLAITTTISTAAGAIAVTNWNRTSPDIWTQETPVSVMKLPGGFGVEEVLY
jgi:hypothetical protein